MSIIDNLLQRMGYNKAGNEPGFLLATAEAERFNIPSLNLPTAQADLMKRLSWVNIAITQLAQACSVQMLNVKKREDDRLVDIPNHPFEVLLDDPNEYTSRMEFMNDTIAWYKLTGNAYWWLNRPNENAEPTEMWVLPSNKITPVPDGNMYLKGYMYEPGDGQQIPLDPWEIVQFKTFNPSNRFVGLSPIESIAVVATGDMEMQKTNTRLYGEEGGKLPSVLAFADPIPQADWIKLQKEVRDSEAKRKMMMLRNAGAGGVQWLANTMSNKDMEFISGRQFTKEEIFNTFAPGLSSMLAINATEANSTAAKETFNEFAVWPVLKFVSEKVNSGVLKAYGDKLYSEFDDPRKTDRVLELQEIQEYGKTHTVVETRQRWYEDDPLGDERDEMLVIQLTAKSAAPQQEEPEQEDTRDLKPDQVDDKPEEDEQDNVKAELEAWQSFEMKRKGKGRAFKCEYVPEALEKSIRSSLMFAVDEEEITAAFDGDTPMKELKRAMDMLERVHD